VAVATSTVSSIHGGDNGRATERQRIIGAAHWSRFSLSNSEAARAGWGLPWWDPRRVLRPLMAGLVRVLAVLGWKNRAADPGQERIVEGSYGFVDRVWDEALGRRPSLYLEGMAVDPDFQGRGVGRLLVKSGLHEADRQGVSASVISADGKEGFYRRCGFDVGPVGRSGEGEGNPLWAVPGGLVFFRERPGEVRSEADVEEERERALRKLMVDYERGWPSVWLKERGKD
jgi:GNAT superfamily N-acetyltransferase